jgi:phosphatidylglycerophosphate synthase
MAKAKKEKVDSNNIETLRAIISKPFLSLHPNIITYSSVLLALLAALFFYYDLYVFSIIFIALSFLFDAIDGYVARHMKKVSYFGAFIDGLADRIVEFLIIFVVMIKFPYFFPQLTILLSFGTFLHSFTKAYASHRKVLSIDQAASLDSIFSRKIRVFGILLIAVSIVLDFYPFFISWFFAILSVIGFFHLLFNLLKKLNKQN